jgi:hypothetical protein
VNDLEIPPGPGVARANGHHAPATAGGGPAPGSVLINWAAWLLTLIGGGALYVSFDAQRQYVLGARHQDVASIVEALLLDLLMITFALLALGLSRAGKPSRTERALILACAVASAWMNVSAADAASPRSIVAYAVAPVALAVVADRVVAVIRRHVQADGEASAWTALGRVLAAAARLTAAILLYTLRFALAPPSTATGLRRWLLAAAPLPELTGQAPAPARLPRCLVPIADTPGVLCWAPLPCAHHPPAAGQSAAAPAAIAARTGPADSPAFALDAARPGAGQAAGPGPQPSPEPGPAAAAPQARGDPEPGQDPAGSPAGNSSQRARAEPVTYEAVRAHYAADLDAGKPPSGKAIRRQFSLGSDRAGQFAAQLAAAAAARPAQ